MENRPYNELVIWKANVSVSVCLWISNAKWSKMVLWVRLRSISIIGLNYHNAQEKTREINENFAADSKIGFKIHTTNYGKRDCVRACALSISYAKHRNGSHKINKFCAKSLCAWNMRQFRNEFKADASFLLHHRQCRQNRNDLNEIDSF